MFTWATFQVHCISVLVTSKLRNGMGRKRLLQYSDMNDENNFRHWRRAVDPSTGRVYYYNKLTRDTCWEPPSDEVDGGAEMDIREATDPHSGRTYYYDRETRKTYWYDPRKQDPQEDESKPMEKYIREMNLNGGISELETYQHEMNYGSEDFDSPFQNEMNYGSNQFDSSYPKENSVDHELEEENSVDDEVEEECSMEYEGSIEDVSITVVRSSLRLLKKNISNKRHHAWAEEATLLVNEPNGTCTRKSGCTCSYCLTVDQKFSTDRIPCKFCKKPFGFESLGPHEDSCGTPRNSKKQSQIKTVESTPIRKTSWRNKSMQLRSAIGSKLVSSKFTSSMNSNGSTEIESDGLIQCPNCDRKFNQKAAERHLPRCKDIVAKPKTLLRGRGKGAYVSKKPIEEEAPKPLQPKRLNSSQKMNSSQNRVSVVENGVAVTECPHCDRSFGRKALERHVEHCTATKTASGKLLRKSSLKSRPASSKETGDLQSLYQQLSMAYDLQPDLAMTASQSLDNDPYFQGNYSNREEEFYLRSSQDV